MGGPGRILAVLLVALAVAGCRPGATVRERITAFGSPLVDTAYSYEEGPLGGANVSVFLVPTTTAADAARF